MKRRVSLLSIFFMLLTASLTLAIDNRPQAGSNLGNVKGGDFTQAHSIIDTQCTKCHSKGRIDTALSSGKDMTRIQSEMEKRGANLTSSDREVLGIYWSQRSPLKK